MSRRRWIRPGLLLFVFCLLGAAVLFPPVGKWHLRRELVRQLQSLTGGEISIDRVQLGLHQQTALGMRISDEDAGEWLYVERAEFSVSLWDAVRGETTPRQVHLTRPSLTLPLAEDGTPLLSLPAGPPSVLPCDEILIRDATVEVRQPARASWTATGIEMHVRRTGSADVSVQGTIRQALDAVWSVQAGSEDSMQQWKLQIATDAVTLDTVQLSLYPLIPPVVETVQARCQTSVEATFGMAADGLLDYRVELSPVELDFGLAGQPWRISEGRGDLIADDHSITITDFTARIDDSPLQLSASTQRKQDGWRGQLQASVQRLQLANYREMLALPDSLNGLCSLAGNGEFSVTSDEWTLSGDGTATIDQADWSGLPIAGATAEIQLRELRCPADGPVEMAGTLQAAATLEEITVADAVRAFPQLDPDDLPEVVGRFTARVRANVPLEKWRDIQAWGFVADLGVSELAVAKIALQDTQLRVIGEGGQIALKPFVVAIDTGGVLRGSATASLDPASTVRFQLQLEEIPLALFPVPETDGKLTGKLTGTLAGELPIADWSNVERWNCTGSLSSDRVVIGDWELTQLATAGTLEAGRLRLETVHAQYEGISVQAAGGLAIGKPGKFQFDFQTSGFELRTMADRFKAQLPADTSAKLAATGRVQGTTNPWAWQVVGNARVTDVELPATQVEPFEITWDVDAKGFNVSQATIPVAGGQVSLSLQFPFDAQSPFTVDGQFKEIPSSTLTAWLPDLPVTLSGVLSGEGSVIDKRAGDGPIITARFQGLRAVYKKTIADDVSANLSYEKQQVSLQFDGDVLGGRLHGDVTGRLSPAPVRELIALAGRVELRRIRIPQLLRAGGAPGSLPTVSGLADATLQVELAAPEYRVRGNGSLVLTDLRIGNDLQASRLQIHAQVDPDRLHLRVVDGLIAHGQLTGELIMPLTERRPASFQLQLRRVAIRPFLPDWAKVRARTDALCDLTLRGDLGPRSMGDGQLDIGGLISGVRVGDARFPFNWEWSPAARQGRASSRYRITRLSGGQATGRIEFGWNGGLWLDGTTEFRSVDIQPIARAMRRTNDLLNGRLSGKVQLQGWGVRSLADLKGSYDISLLKSRALALPVLEVLIASMGFTSASSATFARTEVKGRLSRGILQVEKMTMEAPNARLWIEGHLTTSGRLDFNVTAESGQTASVAVAAITLRPIDLVRRRLIFLHLGGTVRTPMLQPRTAEMVEQEIILFLLPFAMPG